MFTTLKRHLSYANAVSTVALFVVLGGGAYATIDRKITTKDLKKAAVTAPKIKGQAVKTGKIANGAVTEAKLADGVAPSGATGPAGGALTGNYPDPQIANGAVTSAKIATGAISTAKLNDQAVNTAKLADGGVSHAKLSSDAAPRWAVMNGSTGNPQRSRGVTASQRAALGSYIVRFGRDVSQCSYVAQTGGLQAAGFPIGTASAAYSGTNAFEVLVQTRDLNGNLADRDFHVQVLC